MGSTTAVRANAEAPRTGSGDGSVRLRSILATALIVRLAIVAMVLARFPAGWFFRAQGELGFIAQSLVAGRGFSSPFGGLTGPTAFLAPGYPLIVALVFRLFGVFSPASAAAIMLLQTAFCVLTILLVVKIAAQEFGALAANIAGFFAALGIPFLWLPVVFWDTSLSMLSMTGALFLSLRTMRHPTGSNWLLMGLAGGLALLVNPSLFLVLLGLSAWVVWNTRASPALGPLLACLLFVAICAPWPARNARVLHAFVPTRSNFGFELWKGNRPDSSAVDDTAVYPVFNHAEFAAYVSAGEIAYMRAKGRLAQAAIRNDPAAFLRLSAHRFLSFWTGTGTEASSPILALFETASTLFALCGLTLLFRQRRIRLALLFAIPLLLFPLPFYITHAELRFRLLVEPVTSMLGAYALVNWWRQIQRGTKWSTIPGTPL